MSDHEEWESRMQRGAFSPADWARDVKRDIASYQVACAAVRKEVEDNEGDDPMSDEYKRLEMARAHAASNVHRHLNHDVLIAIADLVLTAHSAKSWLDNWAEHVGLCPDGQVCTCGLDAIRNELALSLQPVT